MKRAYPSRFLRRRLEIGDAWVNVADGRFAIEPARLDNLIHRFQRGAGDVLKKDELTAVRRVTQDGRDWVVKQFVSQWWKMRLYQEVRLTAAWREWWGARRLKQIGLRSVQPAALIDARRSNTPCQYLIAPFIEGLNLYWYLSKAADGSAERERSGPDQRRRLADAIGRQVGRLTAAGWINRDHKVSNLILDDACLKDGLEPVIIDPAAIRRRRRERKVYRMLARLRQSAVAAGGVSERQQWRCLRAALRADPTIAPGPPRGRLRRAAEATLAAEQRLGS